MEFRVSSLMEHSLVNGPGGRIVIWAQGCSLNCRDCWNPSKQQHDKGMTISVGELSSWVVRISARTSFDGITLSGGEPMEQAAAVAELLGMLHNHSPNLSIGLFSGYSERELDQGKFLILPARGAAEKRDLWKRVRSHLDFAVLGRYNRYQPAFDPLITSRNQKLQLFSTRYTTADFEPQTVEITIDGSGLTQITGFPVLGSPSQK